MSLNETLTKIAEEFKKAASASYNRVYPQDGLKEDTKKGYYTDRLNKAAAFLGLPNRKIFKRDKQTVKQLGYDFLGLQDGVSPAKKWVNRGLLPFVALFNFVNMFFQTALSIVKLFTEFLPLTMAQFFQRRADAIRKEVDKKPSSPSIEKPTISERMLIPTIYLFVALSIFMHILYFIGRSITSPIEGVKSAWKFGNLAPKSKPWARELVGALFATLSILCTVAVYVILFPLLIKVAASLLAKLGVNLAGTFIPKAIAWLNPVFAPIGGVFAQIASYLSLSAIINASVAFEVGVAAVAAVGITILGTPVSKLLDQFKEWWHRPAPVKPMTTEARESAAKDLGHSPTLLKYFYYEDKSLEIPSKTRHYAEADSKLLLGKSKQDRDTVLGPLARKEVKPLPFTLFAAFSEKGSLSLAEFTKARYKRL